MSNKRSGNGTQGFRKGKSGNASRRFGQPDGNPVDRGGRPKSLGAHIRAELGDNGEAIVQRLIGIMNQRGSAAARVQACRELLNRGWGFPKTEADVTIQTFDFEGARERLAKKLTDLATRDAREKDGEAEK